VWQRTGLRVSVGAGRSKLVAKLASTAAKPRGQLLIARQEEQEFLDTLPVAALPGIGPVAASRLTEMGINSVAQLRAQPARLLERLLGSAGGASAVAASRLTEMGINSVAQLRAQPARLLERLLGSAGGPAAAAMAVGQDSRVVAAARAVKSVSAERTFDFDVPASQLGPVLDVVLDAATLRLHQAGVGARTVTVRLRDGQFTTIGRSVSLAQVSTQPGELRAAAVTALAVAVEAMGLDANEESGVGARLLGVSFGALSPSAQLSLLPTADSTTPSPGADGTIAEVETTRPPAAPTGLWVPGQDVMHTDLGRGWVVRVLDNETSPSGTPEVAVRFEVTGSRLARQRRFAAADPHLVAVEPLPVQPLKP
jgi:DNA polymerase-4